MRPYAHGQEILLNAKDLAEDGWSCLHAIVDSIWLVDIEGRSGRATVFDTFVDVENRDNSGIRIELETSITGLLSSRIELRDTVQRNISLMERRAGRLEA